MNKVQSVEVRFEGELLTTATTEEGSYALYQVPDGGYFVHYDEGAAGAYLVTGLSAAVPNGHLREGISEKQVRRQWPELLPPS
jgi:hypothetical protein